MATPIEDVGLIRGEMTEYNRDKLAQLFDQRASSSGKAHRKGSIPQIIGQIAYERLELSSEDVPLDVGTGTGGMVIAAANICQKAIGIDLSRRSFQLAYQKAKRINLKNVGFAYGSFENPCAELNLASYGITKILAVYSLHHLPDPLKAKSLSKLVGLINRPGRMVIGHLIFFEEPERHQEKFDEMHYDGGETDFPATAEYLTGCLKKLSAEVRVERIHPLAGLVAADFYRLKHQFREVSSQGSGKIRDN